MLWTLKFKCRCELMRFWLLPIKYNQSAPFMFVIGGSEKPNSNGQLATTDNIENCNKNHCPLRRNKRLVPKHICLLISCLSDVLVDGGHRAIIFSRIGGIQNTVYTEGLHFR